MARTILVIDGQKIHADPTSLLHCVGNAEAIANVNAITAAAEAAG
jgi:nicotinamidase-related amidase